MSSNTDMMPAAEYQPCLNFFEQMEVISKARLNLVLKVAADNATLEEKNALHEEQRQKILSFVDLLHDSLLCKNGKVLLCLYQCD